MKRTLSLLLVVVMLVSVFAGLSLPAAAAEEIDVDYEVTLTAGKDYPTPAGRIELGTALEKYTRVSPLDKVEFRYGKEPEDFDMKAGFNEAREFYLYGKPTIPGEYWGRWDLYLENGTHINYYLTVNVKATKVYDVEKKVILHLDEKPNNYYLDISQYKDGTWNEYAELVNDDLPPGMGWSYGEVDSPYIYDAPTAAGMFFPKWRIILGDGTQINYALQIKVEAEKNATSSQDVTLNVFEEYNHVTIDIGDKKTDFVKYCHLVEGKLPWPMEWHYGGEPDLPYLQGEPRVSGEFPTVWELTLYDGTLVTHTMNLKVEPKKVYNSSQMVSLTAFEYANVYFDVNKYKEEYGYVSCDLVEGEIPPGMDWMYGEVDPPRIYGTVGEVISTRAKEHFERTDPSGTYVSKWKICTYDGIQINHTLTCVVTKDGNPFEDVKSSDFFFKAVLWAVTHDPQVTNGVDLTHFGPSKTCTRGQVVTFLWRAMGCPEPTKTDNPFTDVKQGAFYYDAVLWAVEKGITNGMTPTTFEPNSGCTRGQVVTFLWRAEGQPAPTSSENPFTDVKEKDFYYKPVLWAVEKGITNGTSPTTFAPKSTCTRGQIVTFLYRDMAPVNTLVKTDLLMYVEDVMTITDRGVVITGRIANGKVKTGDKIRLIGGKDGVAKDETFTVEAIEMFKKTVDEAEAGDNVGILLGDVDKSKIARGDAMVAAKSDLVPVTKLKGTLQLYTRYDGGRHTPIFDEYKPQFYVNTNDVTGTVTGLPEGGPLNPGEKANNVSVELINPTFCYIGQEITVREGGRTVGVFTVREIQK